MKKHTVLFMPANREVSVTAGTGLLEAAVLAGIPLEAACGGKGTCGKCRVRIFPSFQRGDHPSAGKNDRAHRAIETDTVLACQMEVKQNMVVETGAMQDSPDRKTALSTALLRDRAGPVNPSIKKIFAGLNRPAVTDQVPDLERLLCHISRENARVNMRVLAALPQTIRQADFSVTAALSGDEIIAVEPGDTTQRLYGLALDIGTTTLAGFLLDLRSGAVLAAGAATNTQNVFGADVIARIDHAAKSAKGRRQLQQKVISAVNGIIRELQAQSGVRVNEIYEAVVVGNTTMSHLFMGLDPTYLGPAPFVPACARPLECEAAFLGLKINPSARVVTLPNIAGYIGSDTVGVILATGLDQSQDNCLAVDIGTNGELVLAVGGRLLACSTAAGPAFEAARISHGMRAAEGAIEAVRIENGDLELDVIGGVAPRGICGSGLIDAIAALHGAGLIEPSGRFADPGRLRPGTPRSLLERLRPAQGGQEFILARRGDIVLTQSDIRELQLAKAAIYAGAQTLLKAAGISEGKLDRVLLAGAFGNYVRKESTLAIGLLPQLPPEKIASVGNAAADGAMLALISMKERRRSYALAGKVEHIELSARKNFQDAFIHALSFPAPPAGRKAQQQLHEE